jgi:CheY-like chemotaxis protein
MAKIVESIRLNLPLIKCFYRGSDRLAEDTTRNLTGLSSGPSLLIVTALILAHQRSILTGAKVSDEHKRTIFVVDDESLIARTLATILFGFGFSTTAFTNPLNALLSVESECPDFLLSDVIMPHVNGIDLRIAFCERCPKCRVLLFSGQAETSDLLESAREAGHNFQCWRSLFTPQTLWLLSRHCCRRVNEDFLGIRWHVGYQADGT